MAKKGITPEDEAVKKQQDADWAATKGKRTDADYDKRYAELQSRYGIATPEKSDFRKDMDEYGPRIKAAMNKTKEANKTARIKDTSRPAREEQSMKALKDYETKVKTSNGGYAEAETKEASKKARTAVDRKKQVTTKKNSPRRTPVKAPNLKKPAETPKGGYKPENQDAGGTQRRRQILSDAYTGGKSWPETRKNIGKRVLSIVGAPLKYVNRKLDEQNKKGKNPKPYQLKINN